MEENIIVIRDPKTFCFNLDWPTDVDENVKQKIEFIIKSIYSLAVNKMKNEIEQLLLNISVETIFINTENSKTNEPHKFDLNSSQRLDLRSSNKHVALQNLSIY